MPEFASLGRHLIVELYDCNPEKLNEVNLVEKMMTEAAQKANATVINATFHHFAPFGVSGVVVIQESHLAIHTWPEYGFAAVDLFTCGETVDPWVAGEFLEKAFEAKRVSSLEMSRGQPALLKPSNFKLPPSSNTVIPKIQFTKDIWFTDRASNIALSVKHQGELLFQEQSPYQKIEVYKTLAFGKMLVLDGRIATTEYDEHDYHEMITHIPMVVHPNPKKILVIGGGEGGIVRELVKHHEIKSIHLVELDEKIITVAKEFLPTISSALENEKVTISIGEGFEFLQKSAQTYDLILLDSMDAVSSGEQLYNRAFLTQLYQSLNEEGILITPTGSPALKPDTFQNNYQFLKTIFGENNIWAYMAFMPSYISGMWSFAFCSKGNLHPIQNINSDKQQFLQNEFQLNYYNAEIHQAAFVLPNFVKKLLA